MMQLSTIRALLDCNVFAGEERIHNTQIQFGCAADLMSDVLAFSRAGAVLMTGLVNTQTVQTALIAEISAIILVRGKRPTKNIIALADEKHIPLLGTRYSMYESCGILYAKGLPSTMEKVTAGEHHVQQ